MEKLFLNILSLSLSAAVIGGILILIHPMTRKHFSKVWNYYVWLILALRLLVPGDIGFSPFHISYSALALGTPELTETEEIKITEAVDAEKESGTTGPEETVKASGTIGAEGEETLSGAAGSSETPFTEKRSFGIKRRIIVYVFGVLWLSGAVTVLFIKLLHYRRLIKRMKASCRPVIDRNVIVTANIVALRLKLEKHVPVYESIHVSGPVTMGLFKPFIVLPAEDRKLGDTALILHHELLHVKRKDLWYKWLWQMIICLHWFNPVLLKISRILSEDCELSCDEQILKQLSDNGKMTYGSILLDTAQKNLDFGETIFLTTLLEEKRALKERLKGIIEYKKQSGLKIFLSLCAMVCVMTLSACGNIIIYADEDGLSENDVYEEEEGSFWDIFVPDEKDFLAWTFPVIDKSKEAYRAYDEDELIKGEDTHDVWQAYYYSGGDKVKCKGLCLNGSDSVYIIHAQKATTVEISSEFELVKGKFKIVQTTPDNNVTVLNETGEANSVTIHLQEGRNAIKMVGQAAKIKNIEISHSAFEKDAVEIYYNEDDEYAHTIIEEIQKGNIDKEKAMDAMVYLEEKEVSEVLKELCKQGITLTPEELEDIFIYGNEELNGRYLEEAIKNKEIPPLNGEMIRCIIYYARSETLAELIILMDPKELTFDVLADCVVYLDESEAGKCLSHYLDQGNSLTYSQYTKIAYYLDKKTRQKIESEMQFQKAI